MDCRPSVHPLPATIDDRCGNPLRRFAAAAVPAIALTMASGLAAWPGIGPGTAFAQQAATATPPAVAPAAAGPAPVALRAPSASDRQMASVVAKLMPSQHVSAQDLNDQISQRSLKLFLEMLDPMKIYFEQSDIDEFKRYENSIDDMVRKGDISLAYFIFRRFSDRVDQRVELAKELLETDFDFTENESIVIDPKDVSYPANAGEARDRWRRQIKYALLVLKEDGKVGEEAKDQLRRRYERNARRWKQTDGDDLLELFLTSVTMGYDPHSTYMSPGTLEDFRIQMRLNLDGIGAALREKDGSTVVSSVIPGGAADLHGKLKPDDVIVSVGQGEDGEMVDIVEMPLKDVVDQIRGKAGTVVRLGVQRAGVSGVEEYRIVRAKVELEESAARGEVISHTVPGSDQQMKIGYINLPSFYLDMEKARLGVEDYRSSTRDVRKILDDFRRQNVKAVVLDLSKNGGGSLTEAITLTGLFIDYGPVVQVKDADGKISPYDDEERGVAWDGPLVVLTSKLSASASEILAGAIRDYHRGIVVGDPATHGKGTVQTLLDIGEAFFKNPRENMGALKVTLQQFYLPDGESTQLAGVPADVILPSIIAKADVAEGDLKYALANDRVPKTKHVLYPLVPKPLIDSLRQSSQSRIAQNEEFGDLLRRIELYVRQKEENSVSLNADEFARKRKELDVEKEELAASGIDEDATAEEKEKIYPDTYYYDEVLNIAAEYVEGLRQQNLAKN